MTTILIKKKDTAGAPAPGDLTNAAGGAEIAVNTATKRLYTKDSGGTVVEVGTNPSALTTNLLFSPDATYDIGASGASRPRDLFLSRNLTVGGTMTVTGGINFNGNVTVGDSSADTLTINSTITSNLIFTDNTYDIGASGATRPRTGYFGTSIFTPLLDATNVEATNIKALDGTSAASIANSTGVISFVANPILSGGTANGVLYLNGSKVATSGSTFTYDGTQLLVNSNSTTTPAFFQSNDGTTTQANSFGTIVRNANDGNGRYSLSAWRAQNASGLAQYAYIGAQSVTGASNYTPELVFGLSTGASSYAEQMRLTITGLGIGTTTPFASLHVTGTGSLLSGTPPALSATDPGYSGLAIGFTGVDNMAQLISTNPSSAQMAFYTKVGAGTAPAERMRITTTGLVGIGTNGPLTALQVNSGSTYVAGFKSTTTNGFIAFQDSGTSGVLTDGTVGIGANADDLVFRSGGANRARLGGTGNLGLGVTAAAWLWPDSSTGALQLQAGAAFSGYNAGAVVSQNWYYNAGEKFIGNGYASRYSQSSGIHAWSVSTASNASGAGAALTWAESMRITTAGKVAMGSTTTPQGRLSVWGSNASSIELSLDSNATYAQIQTYSSSPLYLNPLGNNVVSNLGGGVFYIGKATSSTTVNGWGLNNVGTGGTNFSVTNNEFFTWDNYNGSGTVQMDFRWNNIEVGSITYTSSAVAYNTGSDYRLKDNPQPLTGSGAFIDSLKPKTWAWKIDGSRGVGFIAHELQEVGSSSVYGEKDALRDDGVTPKYQSVEYGSPEFIANIVLELQSLRQRVAQLETGV
jgi:hypothetical protein